MVDSTDAIDVCLEWPPGAGALYVGAESTGSTAGRKVNAVLENWGAASRGRE